MKKVKLLTAALLGALMMCLLVPVAAQAKVYYESYRLAKGSAANLVTEDGKTYYVVNGEKITDRIVDFGKKATCKTSYYFGEDGAMVKKQRIFYKGDYLYAGGKGKLQKNRWVKGKYYDKEGYCILNRYKKMPGNPSNGVYQIGKKSVKCYLYENGQRVTSAGWHAVENAEKSGFIFYYVNSNGQAAVNQWVKDTSITKNSLMLQKISWIAEGLSYAAPYYIDRNGEYNPRYSKKKSILYAVWPGIKEDIQYSAQTILTRQWINIIKPVGSTGYTQWVRTYGNCFYYNGDPDARPMVKVTDTVEEQFGIGLADNPWCMRVWNCTVTKKAVE